VTASGPIIDDERRPQAGQNVATRCVEAEQMSGLATKY
jgi:hypothetical protein